MTEKNNMQQEIENNKDAIALTSINTEAIKKISNKKVSLQKKAINALLATLILGGAAFGGYKFYEHQKALEIEISQIPTVEEIMEDQTGTIIFDGEEINIEDLKEQYGLAYYFYEPLTEEQINEQFRGMIKFHIERAKEYEDIDESLGFCDQYGLVVLREYGFNFLNKLQELDYEYLRPVLLANTTYHKYFNQGIITGNESGFVINIPEIANYESGLFYETKPTYNVDSISMEAKSLYVRYWKYYLSSIKLSLQEKGLLDEYMEYNPHLSFEDGFSYQPVVRITI